MGKNLLILVKNLKASFAQEPQGKLRKLSGALCWPGTAREIKHLQQCRGYTDTCATPGAQLHSTHLYEHQR